MAQDVKNALVSYVITNQGEYPEIDKLGERLSVAAGRLKFIGFDENDYGMYHVVADDGSRLSQKGTILYRPGSPDKGGLLAARPDPQWLDESDRIRLFVFLLVAAFDCFVTAMLLGGKSRQSQ
jgi:hypothetical protein